MKIYTLTNAKPCSLVLYDALPLALAAGAVDLTSLL